MMRRALPFLLLALASFGVTRLALAAFAPAAPARPSPERPVTTPAPARPAPGLRAAATMRTAQAAEPRPCQRVRVVYRSYGPDPGEACALR